MPTTSTRDQKLTAQGMNTTHELDKISAWSIVIPNRCDGYRALELFLSLPPPDPTRRMTPASSEEHIQEIPNIPNMMIS